MDFRKQQEEICLKYKTLYYETPAFLKVGISLNIKNGARPINGLRHSPEGDTSGWYIWGGEELSDDPDFFVPLHIDHLVQWYPEVIKYLGLPPGWRFLVDSGYEDVWEDQKLLST